VAEIVARPIVYKVDQLAMRGALRVRRELIHRIAYRVNDIDVATFGLTADVISLAGASAFQHQRQRLGMVINEQPVAHIEPPAVDWHRLTFESLDDIQRNELFWKLMWTIVIRAVGEQGWQPIGMAPRPHQMIGCRLACRIG